NICSARWSFAATRSFATSAPWFRARKPRSSWSCFFNHPSTIHHQTFSMSVPVPASLHSVWPQNFPKRRFMLSMFLKKPSRSRSKPGLARPKRSQTFLRKKNTTTFARETIIQVQSVLCLPGMDKIRIHGGHSLSGSIKISGSKNSALPILAATLLTREPCTIHRVPDLSDTNYMVQILTHLGAQVERASGTVTVTADKATSVAPYDVVRKMRASVCVLGPLLGRCKESTVSMPGGCI